MSGTRAHAPEGLSAHERNRLAFGLKRARTIVQRAYTRSIIRLAFTDPDE